MSIAGKSPQRFDELTVSQARLMRADQARLAALYADRAEQARTSAEATALAYWLHEYRRSAVKCRLLGERIRRAEPGSGTAAAECTPTPIRSSSQSVPAPSATQEAA